MAAVILVAGLGLGSGAIAKPKPLTADEKQALSEWAKHQPDSGVILNIPGFRQDPRVANIEKAVRDIIMTERPDLFKKFNLVINVYSSQEPNAFISYVQDPVSSTKDQKAAKQDFVHRLYRLNPKKPVFELGVHVGLMRLTETVDQLAFVISHELTHLEEGHAKPIEAKDRRDRDRQERKLWWSRQQYEIVADYGGLEKMVGHYEPEAAIEILKALHAEVDTQTEDKREYAKSAKAAESAFEKGIQSSHHHDGIRIASVQAQIEMYRRTRGDAQPKPQTPLNLWFGRNPRLKTSNTPEELKTLLRFQENLLRQMIRTGKVVDHGATKPDILLSLDTVKTLMEDGVRIITTSKLSDQRKFDELFMYTDTWKTNLGTVGRYVTQETFVQEQVNVLVRPMLELLRSPDYDPKVSMERFIDYWHDWNPGSTRDGLRKTIGKYLEAEFHSRLIEKLLVHANGRRLAAQLINEILWFGGKRSLTNLASALDSFTKTGETTYLSVLVNEKTALNPRLYREFEGLVISYLNDWMEEGGARKIFQQGDYVGLNDIKSFIDLARREKTESPLIDSLKVAYSRAEKFVLENRLNLFERITRSAEISNQDLSALGQHLELVRAIPLTNLEQGSVEAIALRVSDAMDRPRGVSVGGLLSFHKLLLPILNYPASRTKSERIKLFRLMGWTLNDLSLQGGEDFEAYKKLTRDLTSDFSKEDFFSIFGKTYASQENALFGIFKTKKFIEDKNYLIESMKPGHESDFAKFCEVSGRVRHLEFRLQLFLRQKWASLRLISVLGAEHPIMQRLTFQDLRRIVLEITQSGRDYKSFYLKAVEGIQDIRDHDYKPMTGESTAFLLDIFLSTQKEVGDVHLWAKTLRSIIEMSSQALELRPEARLTLEERFIELTSTAEGRKQAFDVLNIKSIRSVLSERSMVPVFIDGLKQSVGEKPSLAVLRRAIDGLDQSFELRAKNPDLYVAFKERAAEAFKLQPHTIQRVMPEEKNIINTESTANFAGHVRGLSAMVAASEHMQPTEVIELIDYLMGKTPTMPNIVHEMQKTSRLPIVSYVISARIQIRPLSILQRTYIVDTFLASDHSPLASAEGRELVLSHFLKSTSNKSVGLELARAMIKSQGQLGSLSLAYIFAQKPEVDGKALSEGQIIKSLFEAFGAPGIKLGQYLAFTGEMKEYRHVLAELQDAAMPISYLDAIRLVRSALGREWGSGWEVTRILGTGSVNIALEIQSVQTGEVRVVSILRKDIETATKENFRKLRNLVQELVNGEAHLPLAKKRYSFLLGLLDLLERSVSLEFNKPNAFAMQKVAVKRYAKQASDGWTVQSVEPTKLYARGMEMMKAPGITARKLLQQNPEMYKEVMRHILSLEFEHLMTHEKGELIAFANPDLHDGQVLIDLIKKIITILDFGQAIKITNAERDIGVDFLRVVSGADSKGSMKKTLERIRVALGATEPLTDLELALIEQRTERMDRFTYLTGVLENKGWEVPTSIAHWIQGVNRMIVLGEKIDVDIEAKIRNLLIVSKLGGSLEFYNGLRRVFEAAGVLKTRTGELFQPPSRQPMQKTNAAVAPPAGVGLTCELLFK